MNKCKFNKPLTKMKNFYMLYYYIQCADRDDVGVHYPLPGNEDVTFHIYENRKQLNICINNNPVAVFIFDTEKQRVKMYRVIKGSADYDSEPYQCFFQHDTNNCEYMYEKAFGEIGLKVSEIIDTCLFNFWYTSKPAHRIDVQFLFADIEIGYKNLLEFCNKCGKKDYESIVSETNEYVIRKEINEILSNIEKVKQDNYLGNFDVKESSDIIRKLNALEIKLRKYLK